MHTDNGKEFFGKFGQLLKKYGIAHYTTKPRSPWQNGKVERYNKELNKLKDPNNLVDHINVAHN